MHYYHKIYLLSELSPGILNHATSHPRNFILNSVSINLVTDNLIVKMHMELFEHS